MPAPESSQPSKPAKVVEIKPGVSQEEPFHDLSGAEHATQPDTDVNALEAVGQTLSGDRSNDPQRKKINRRRGAAIVTAATLLAGAGAAIQASSGSDQPSGKGPKPIRADIPTEPAAAAPQNPLQVRVEELEKFMMNPDNRAFVTAKPREGADQLGQEVNPGAYIRTDGVKGYPADPQSVEDRAAIRQIVKEETASTGGQPGNGEQVEIPRIPEEQLLHPSDHIDNPSAVGN